MLQLVDDGLHLVVVETLAGQAVEADAQALVHGHIVGEGDLFEPLPQGIGLLVALFQPFEPSARLLVEGGVFLGLAVKTHVYVHQFAHAARLDLLA